MRHARATEASITVKRDIDGIRIDIADNGIGFDSRCSAKGGLGNMEARAAKLGARYACVALRVRERSFHCRYRRED
ncbi:MAG: hypothetical protein U0361_13125 [Nitrospiraceae bacterium]